MGAVLTFLSYAVFGFIGLLVLLFLLAILFGKRIVREWDYEAEFHDASGKEFADFDIEKSRIEKEEPDFTIKAKFKMRHASLAVHQTIQVFVDDTLVLEGMVEKAGRLYLTSKEHRQNNVDEVKAGQVCRIVSGGRTLFEEPLSSEDH